MKTTNEQFSALILAGMAARAEAGVACHTELDVLNAARSTGKLPTLGKSPRRSPSAVRGISHARAILRHYEGISGVESRTDGAPLEQVLADLLTDLFHYTYSLKACEPGTMLDAFQRAERNFIAETR